MQKNKVQNQFSRKIVIDEIGSDATPSVWVSTYEMCKDLRTRVDKSVPTPV